MTTAIAWIALVLSIVAVVGVWRIAWGLRQDQVYQGWSERLTDQRLLQVGREINELRFTGKRPAR